jgi:hypothetical protein
MLRLAIMIALAACGHREPQPIATGGEPPAAASDAAQVVVDSPAAMPDATVPVDAAAMPADSVVTSPPSNVQNSYLIVKLDGDGPDTMLVVDGGSDRGITADWKAHLVAAGGARGPALRIMRVEPRRTHLKAAMSVDQARGYQRVRIVP